MNARRHGSVVVASALIATLMVSSPALTAGPGGGGGQPGDTTGSLYADLVIALRAENGTPILQTYTIVDVEKETTTTEYCVQPVSYEAVPGLESTTNPVDGRTVWVLPLQGEWLDHPDTMPPGIDPTLIGPCDPQPQYAMFVAEVALERLNLARTSDQVIADKLGDVEMKLRFAEEIALQSTGRITFDGTTIDASPENAAIYQSLMTTGTIPGLPAGMVGPPAEIGPAGGSNSQFDAWELAAVAIGAAASKSTPLNVDTVEYYNRIAGFPASTTGWDGVSFVRSEGAPADSERFVNYSGFSYNRSETFKGSVTWLDVPTLTWTVSKITDVVPFTNLSSYTKIGENTLHGVVAFAQLADDVRAMSNFIPDNTFIPGFFMDVPGFDTGAAQAKAITEPAVDLGTLPEIAFRTYPFEVTASLLNPFGGTLIPDARLRLTVDAPGDLVVGDVTATATDGQSVPFTAEGGNLVGWWGPPTGFPAAPGYNASTTFTATVAATAPTGSYSLTLELVTASDTGTVRATDTGSITVNDNVATVMWGDPVPKFTTQGTWATIPLRVYSPSAGEGDLTLTVTGPSDDPLAAGDVTVYRPTATEMVAVPMALDGSSLVGTGPATLDAGYTDVTWYASVAVGAPVGDYTVGVGLTGGNTLAVPKTIVVFAPEEHGGTVPDTILPVVTITPVGTPGADATFNFTVEDANLATIECQLTKDGTVMAGEDWAVCTSPKTYTGLSAGAYVFSVRGTDKALNVGTATSPWTVAPPPPVDTTPPVVTIQVVGMPASSATFNINVEEESPFTIECQLTKNDTAGVWKACTSPQTYSGLKPGTYVFSARATDSSGNVSEIASSSPWTVKKGGGA